jgi:hypothetical protein
MTLVFGPNRIILGQFTPVFSASSLPAVAQSINYPAGFGAHWTDSFILEFTCETPGSTIAIDYDMNIKFMGSVD